MPSGNVFAARQSAHDPLVIEFRMVSEIHQDSEAVSRGVEVVVNLCTRLVAELLDGLDLQMIFSKQMKSGSNFFFRGRPLY